jgi:hypothetical protein
VAKAALLKGKHNANVKAATNAKKRVEAEKRKKEEEVQVMSERNSRMNTMVQKQQEANKQSLTTTQQPIQQSTPKPSMNGYKPFGGGRRRTVNKRLNKRSSRRSTYRR